MNIRLEPNVLSYCYRHRQMKCVYNKPANEDRILLGVPGQVISADEQCKILGQLKSCEVSLLVFNQATVDFDLIGRCFQKNNVCTRLYCQSTNDPASCTGMESTTAEGTRCGEHMVLILFNSEKVHCTINVYSFMLTRYFPILS